MGEDRWHLDEALCAARDYQDNHRCQLFAEHTGHDHTAVIFTDDWAYSRGTIGAHQGGLSARRHCRNDRRIGSPTFVAYVLGSILTVEIGWNILSRNIPSSKLFREYLGRLNVTHKVRRTLQAILSRPYAGDYDLLITQLNSYVRRSLQQPRRLSNYVRVSSDSFREEDAAAFRATDEAVFRAFRSFFPYLAWLPRGEVDYVNGSEYVFAISSQLPAVGIQLQAVN